MSSTTEWEVWCETDSKWVSGLKYVTSGTPTSCFDNIAHTITTTGSNAPSIKKENNKSLVTLNEGLLTETGQLVVSTVAFDCPGPAGTVSTGTIKWPYSISAIQMYFQVEEANRGDLLSLSNAPIDQSGTLRPVGALTASITVPTAHTDQNYVSGDVVTYVGRTYTCILNTVSNETPYDETYWKLGMRLAVTSTVTDNCNHGFEVHITDGVNTDNLGEIYDIDKAAGYIYVQNTNTIANSYSAASPTYVYVTVHMMREFELSGPGPRAYGGNKIGGSDLPKNTLVTISYKNVDGVAGKRFVGEVELVRGTNAIIR
jgi:hypothetical protein